MNKRKISSKFSKPSPLLSALRIKIAYLIETTRIKLQIIRLTAPIHWDWFGGFVWSLNIVWRTYNGLVPLIKKKEEKSEIKISYEIQ